MNLSPFRLGLAFLVCGVVNALVVATLGLDSWGAAGTTLIAGFLTLWLGTPEAVSGIPPLRRRRTSRPS